MRVDSAWLEAIDDWRRAQTDIPPRAEAIRRLVAMGLRFGIEEGDRVDTPVGKAKVLEVHPAIGCVTVETKNGDGHSFGLNEIALLP